MIWYIRPPSGGQFGPAPGELMRTWISEGRVSADSLVWREGWRDWQEAGAVFPKLPGNQLVDMLESIPAVPAAAHTQSAASSQSHQPKSGASSDRGQMALLIVLSVLVVVLLIIFIYFVTRP